MSETSSHRPLSQLNFKDTALKSVPEGEKRLRDSPLVNAFLDNSDDVRKYQGAFSRLHASANKYIETVLDANIENWIDLLGDITFATVFEPIEIEDAKFFIEVYEAFEKGEKLTEEQNERSLSLERRIDAAIDRLHIHGGITGTGKGSDGVFVKFSSRSAKDAPIKMDKIKRLFSKYMSAAPDTSMNSRINAILRAGTDLLKIRNAKEALDLFYRSERVYQDMLMALDNIQVFRENVVIREWIDMDPMLEFRGFVYNGELTALSQYNHLVYHAPLVRYKDRILDTIHTWFNHVVKPKLNLANNRMFDACVIDFGMVLLDDDTNAFEKIDQCKLYVIEINPFLESTDPALFSWAHDMDILTNSNSTSATIDFRVQTNVMPSAESQLMMAWREIVRNYDL